MTVALGVCKPAGRTLEKADHGASNSLPSVHSIALCFFGILADRKGLPAFLLFLSLKRVLLNV